MIYAAARPSPDSPREATSREAASHHAKGDLLHAAEAYGQAFRKNPRNYLALLGLSLIALQTNQLQPALGMACAALDVAPKAAVAWTHLGNILLALGHAQSREAFERALQLNPHEAAAHFGLGNLDALRENYAAALACFQNALKAAPDSPESLFAIGFAHAKLGDHTQSIQHYRKAVALRPSFASAWLNLGVALIADGRPHLAELCYQQALAAQPTLISARINLGNLARSRRQFPLAHKHYATALALQPRNIELHLAFCYLHLEQQQFTQAWDSLRTAESINCDDPELHNAKGILLLAKSADLPAPMQLAQIARAIETFWQAESLGHKAAASNRGNALLRLGLCAEALKAHEAAVSRDPIHPGARYNLALTQLRLGDYSNGWLNYEARWRFREVHPSPRRFAQPLWQGELLYSPHSTARRLLIYSEQGLGDTIQFLRYLPLVIERGAQLLFEVQASLVPLLRGFIHSLNGKLIAHGDPLPPFDLHCPLMSLPAIFKTNLQTVPNRVPYLFAAQELVVRRARELDLARTPELKVGVAWAGNPNYRADRDRSTQLETLVPLLKLPGIRWFSLQKNASPHIAGLPASIGIEDASSNDRDLSNTAALIHNLDLVIATDSAVAHLAGALGKPLWLLLPWQSDWRWMQDKRDTPWYPTARLFRQPSLGNWPELVEEVSIALAELAANHSSQPL